MVEDDSSDLTPERVAAMATLAGVHLSRERAEVLATQAAPHFALLSALNEFVDPHTEPAGIFRLPEAEDEHGA